MSFKVTQIAWIPLFLMNGFYMGFQGLLSWIRLFTLITIKLKAIVFVVDIPNMTL